MSDSPVKKFFLPAFLVSIAVFLLLGLSFTTNKDNPLIAKLLLLGSRDVQLGSRNTYGNLVIRYVGVAIILSVGSGVATVEGIRKWQAWQEAGQDRKQRLRAAAALLNPDAQKSELSTGDQDATLQPGSENNSSNLMPELEWHYPVCRVRVPHHRHHRLAIVSEGMYYSFVRLDKTGNTALRTVAALAQNGRQAMITDTKNGHAIWAAEPDAYIELGAMTSAMISSS
jgi:hypothetical protein